MEIRTLKYFVAVARQLSFSHAAESLFVTQSSLSKNISALEKELGVELFIRKGRSISLTAAGEELLSGAEALLDEEADLATRVAQIKGSRPLSMHLIFQLRQPVPSNFDFCRILVETALEFKKTYAPLNLEFRYDTEPYPIRDISGSQNTADIYFSMANEVKMDPELNICALTKDPFYLLASEALWTEAKDYASRSDAEDESRFAITHLLQRHPLLIMEDEGNAVLDISEVLQMMNIPPNMRFVKGQMNLLAELATDQGLALMPGGSSLRMQIDGIHAIQLPEDFPQVSLFALYRKDSENTLLPLFIKALDEKIHAL
jgi:DNA-binding transcriptional LysR family regulator